MTPDRVAAPPKPVACESDLAADLLRPDRYPPPRPSSVSLETTHLSWVFLTDTDAWKVKRPVNYGFADYSTPDRRRHFCEEEVRLNRRLAPDVYLGVWPVRRDGGGYSLTSGEVVDYAVRMRRLPRDRSAEALLEDGRLDPGLLDLLARSLAGFYEQAAPLRQFGGVDTLWRTLQENLDEIEPFAGDLVGVDEVRWLRDWQESFLERKLARFHKRSEEDRVREGHGDLRLEHVYFIDGRPIVIDGVEFAERFRFVDVASDAAFLAMELEHRRRPDLAGWFLARFAAASHDFDFYPLLDYYLCSRALVRAKIAGSVASDAAVPLAKRERKKQEARSLFTLATAFTRPPVRDARLIVLGGPVGTGKSTLAEGLSKAMGWPVAASDPARKFLAGLAPCDPGGPDLYQDDITDRVYAEILRRAELVLESRRTVILDATFARRDHRDRLRLLARKLGVPLLFVETRCEPALARARLRKRAEGPSVSDAREELVEASHRDFEPALELPESERLVVDTGASPSRILPTILDRVL